MQAEARVRIPANMDKYQLPIVDYDNLSLGAPDFNNPKLQVCGPCPHVFTAPSGMCVHACSRLYSKDSITPYRQMVLQTDVAQNAEKCNATHTSSSGAIQCECTGGQSEKRCRER